MSQHTKCNPLGKQTNKQKAKVSNSRISFLKFLTVKYDFIDMYRNSGNILSNK